MRGFFQAFPNCDALRHELSGTHYRLLLRVDAPEARQWYLQEAAAQNWNQDIGLHATGVDESAEMLARQPAA